MKRLLLLLLPIAAFAQSVPNGTITQGEVWTPAQWNNAWQSKTDYPAPCAALPSFTGAITSSGCGTTLAQQSANTVLGCGASACAPSGLTAAPLAALQNTYSSASVLRARDYGILALNTATQNDTGFSALKAAMQASPNTVWKVIFEPTQTTATISNVAITGTAGQFSCTCTGLAVGQLVIISGTYGGTGSITSYTNPTSYYVSATNGTSTFTLQTPAQGAVVTTAGTPTGLIYTPTLAYAYTNNRWLFFVKNVIIDAYGANFMTVNSVSYENEIPLMLRAFWDTSGDVPGADPSHNGVSYQQGYLFNTAYPGPFTVTTTTAGDAANFAPGNRVALIGFSQQNFNGWPPNVRYFEYKTVSTVNAGTGVVTFTEPVKNFYDSRWYDYPYTDVGGTTIQAGAPRIINLNAAGVTWANMIWIKGATFIARDPNVAQNVLQAEAADLYILEDVTALVIDPTAANQVYLWRDHVASVVTTDIPLLLDKVVDTVIVDGGEYSPSIGAANDYVMGPAGPTNLIVKNAKLWGSVDFSPIHAQISNVDFLGGAADFACIYTIGGYSMDSLEVDNTRCNAPTGGLSYAVNWGTNGAATAGVGSAGTTILFALNPTGYTVSTNLGYGDILTDTTTGGYGPVSGIYKSGANLAVTIDNTGSTWTAGLANGDALTWVFPRVVSDGGGNTLTGTYSVSSKNFWQNSPALAGSPAPPYSFTGTFGVNRTGASNTNIADTSNSGNTVIGNDSSASVQIFGNISIENNGSKNVGIMNGSASGSFYLGSNSIGSININGFTQINSNNGTGQTRISDGSTTGAVLIGGDHNLVTLGSPTVMGATTATATVSASTCATLGTYAGSGTAGSFVITTGGAACIFTVTLNGATGMTAPTGWVANADDVTTGIHCTNTATVSQTTVVFTCTTVSGNTIKWSAVPY